MKVRRVVTAQGSDGKSFFLSDEDAPRSLDYAHIPGMSNTQVWSTAPEPRLELTVRDPSLSATTVIPAVGGTQLMIVRFPPDTVMQSPSFDPAAADSENRAWLPGLGERFESHTPGMHTTDTIDYGIVLSGEIWLELDDGLTCHLRPHDVIIQNGTRHAWRNKSDREASLAFVLIGAQRTR